MKTTTKKCYTCKRTILLSYFSFNSRGAYNTNKSCDRCLDRLKRARDIFEYLEDHGKHQDFVRK